MAEKDSGGFLHPTISTPRQFQGITRRDWLAGLAMQGELACQTEKDGIWPSPYDGLVTKCYRVADAMIQESQK